MKVNFRAILLSMACTLLCVTLSAQNVSLNLGKVTVKTAISALQKQSGYSFVFASSDFDVSKSVEVNAKTLEEAVRQITAGQNVTYDIRPSSHKVVVSKISGSKPDNRKRTVTGTVSDDQGPIIGGSVFIKGTSVGTITDNDGSFSLPGVRVGDVLVFSCLGYATKEVEWNGNVLDIRLDVSSEMLDDVVVTALGIKRSEKALSYNVQQLGGDELTTVKDANFISSLVGKVAGVTINSSNNAGGASRVVMRGVKSITSSNQALYVIDGIPMYNMSNAGGGSIYSQTGTDGAADINPEDIESISMLTGPSAAALYGNAAAAGVVLITTKKGSIDKTSVTLSNNTTFSSVTMLPEMQSKYGNEPNVLDSWGPIVNSDYDPKDFFRTGTNTISSIALSTGNRKNQTYMSATSTNTRNILPNSNYDRYNITFRNTTNFLNDKMTLDAGFSYVIQKDKNMMSQGYYYNPLPALYRFPRSENFDDVRMFERYNVGYGVMEQYWPYGGWSLGLKNPYWIQKRQLRQNKKHRYMMNASLKYQIFDWLDITGRAKIDNYENLNTYKAYASSNNTLESGSRGAYNNITSRSKNTYADIIATVNKTFDDWSLNVNLGASINDSRYEMLGYSGGLRLYNFFAVHNIDFGKSYEPNQSGWHDQTQAVFANAELGWKSMLFLTVTGRNDWDSRLAYSDYSSFFYPSVGLSAILSSMFDAPQWLTFLKVRGSYTEVGNAYDRFMTKITYPYDSSTHNWSTTSSYPNTKLKPERTKSYEFGLDMRLFNDLKFNITYYHSNTYNQTFRATLSLSSGYSSIPLQSGNIMNEGIEMGLGYDHQWGDFSFGTNYTLTYNKNEVKRLADGVLNFVTGEPLQMPELSMLTYGHMDARLILRVGGSMGDVYGQRLLKRNYNGYIYYNQNTGLALENHETYLGSILPKMNMGWTFHFGYKGVNLGMTFSGRFGGIVISETQSVLNAAGVSKESADARDAGGIDLNYMKISAQEYYQKIQGTAAYYTYKADNVRLGELSLSYDLPKKWFRDKVGVNLGIIGKNLWMIYCKAPFDPEITSAAASNYYQGFDAYQLPSTRNIGFNIKCTF